VAREIEPHNPGAWRGRKNFPDGNRNQHASICYNERVLVLVLGAGALVLVPVLVLVLGAVLK
jgi:hypothetical protein